MLKYKIRIAAAALTVACLPLVTPARAAKAPAKPTAAHAMELSAAQKQKLLALEKKAQAEVTAVQKGKGTDAQKQAKINALAQKYDKLQLAILTPAQKKKVLAVRAEQKASADRTAAVAKTLTPAQKKQIEGFRAAFFKKVKALETDKKLTPAQKQAKFASYRDTLGKQVEGILSKRQKAMMKGK